MHWNSFIDNNQIVNNIDDFYGMQSHLSQVFPILHNSPPFLLGPNAFEQLTFQNKSIFEVMNIRMINIFSTIV